MTNRGLISRDPAVFFFYSVFQKRAVGRKTSRPFRLESDVEIRPSFSEFKDLAEQGNLIPLYQEILADTDTPVSAYLKIRDKSFSYLLESADGGERWGRYSFIGYKPFLTVQSRGKEIEILEKGEKKIVREVENPLSVLRDLIRDISPVTIKGLPPFQGGFVGYFNYDLIRTWEHLPGICPEDMPESMFTCAGRLIVFDHLTHQVKVVAFAYVRENEDLKDVYDRACDGIRATIQELQGHLPTFSKTEAFSVSELKSNFKKEDFEEIVRRAKEHIVAGDVIQVVLSQRFSGEMTGDDFILYRNLRSINPSPYMFYLNFGEVRLVGSSPEILVRLTDGKIELRPIAGTRQRGMTPEEDQALEADLMADPKERAEHIMLVDLGRNDAGKVATAGSVSVPSLMGVEYYSHVMHIVSSVEGILSPDMDEFDLFMAAFPAGTVSGAPKIRSMEIISDLEPTPRGPYAGAVGYFGFNGNMDFCITIRTISIIGNKLAIQAGAGIVVDSSPEGEYHETLRKAAAMFGAIERAKACG
ncbi:MAG: anthranilate synthase component I [Deltaproteobacteria bacterium]|nr:anthranilate synthase component I [Deltaproteobacteria bacterium]